MVALTRDLRLSAVIAGVTVLPLFAITLARVRRGTWGNLDVSDRGQRNTLYVFAIPLTLAGAAYLFLTNAGGTRSALIAAAMLTVAFALSRFVLKVSLHLMFIGWAGVLLMREHPHAAALLLPFVMIAVGWSRRRLERHTRGEIVTGGLIGIAGGAAAIFFG